jgi:signal transduction histidine kinase
VTRFTLKGSEAPSDATRQHSTRSTAFERASVSLSYRADRHDDPNFVDVRYARIPAIAWLAICVTIVLASVFTLACLWKFYGEAVASQLLNLPYDVARENEDKWRFIWMETAFATISLILPTIALARAIGFLSRTLTEMTASRKEAIAATSAKSRFLANMSHELRTPLNAIIGFSELTKEQMFGPLDKRYRDYAADIHQSGVHLLTIINDVLDLSKLETHNLNFNIEDIDLPGNIAPVVQMLKPLCEKAQVAMCVELSATLPVVRADPIRLRQILLNLLSNAIKFTPAGGLITLSASPVPGFVAISIADTGIGIASENLKKVVQPFFQVDADLNRTREGTGLGLAITVRLVESMGGRFELESELDVGTRVTVFLPCVFGKIAAAA